MNRELAFLFRQQTIAAPIACIGIGLHSGRRVAMRLLPAGPDHGIVFVRRDLPAGEAEFEARWNRVSGTELGTTLGNAYGHHLFTVEHLLAALSGLGIDNVRVELGGPEVPLMDGSALPFVKALLNAGVAPLEAPRDVLVIRRPVRLQYGNRWSEMLPASVPRVTVSIEFPHGDIGRQSIGFGLSPSTFVREIAAARTFGFAEQLWQLRRRGLVLGGSIHNAILVKEGRVANEEGLRFSDEFVRHKALDAVGDLALAGLPIIGHYRAHRPGHRLNNDLLRLLMNDVRAWQRVPAGELLAGAFDLPQPAMANQGGNSRDCRSPAADDRSGLRDAFGRVRRLFEGEA